MLAAPVAAGVGIAAVVIQAKGGMLKKVIVIAAGTAAISLYDNAAAAAGTVLLTIPANTVAGTIYDLNEPVQNGITAGQVNNSPALEVTYDD